MHGATIVALHSAPDVLMVPMQQPDCGPGEGRGIQPSEGQTSSNVRLWLRDIVYRDEHVTIMISR